MNIKGIVQSFVQSINKAYDNEPLDGDETQHICDMVLLELNFQNGND